MLSVCASARCWKVSEAVTGRISSLAALMRSQGSRVGVGELLGAQRALTAVDTASRQDAKLALRAVLCSTRVDLERFELAFETVFARASRRSQDSLLSELGMIEKAALPHVGLPAENETHPQPEEEDDPERDDELILVPAAYSSVELLRHKDFAHYTDAEMAQARELIARLARRGPSRLSRRRRPSRRRTHEPDLRRTIRSSLRTAGEPLDRRWRGQSRRPRPVVLVCDVSGSMAPYARLLMQYLHACVAARRRVEAFAFGTRLTRITNELAGRDHDRALDRAVAAVSDFSGGTRIGAALAELNRVHGRRVGRGAVVVILSDGWDRGEPEQLDVEMARLRRAAFRLVWLNPLAAHPDYQPLARGMQAAVPHTDRLLGATRWPRWRSWPRSSR